MKIVCDTGLSVHIYDVFVVCGVCGRFSGRGKLLGQSIGIVENKFLDQSIGIDDTSSFQLKFFI